MSFSKSVYHIVFSTKDRANTIHQDKERIVYKILYDIMKKKGAFVYRIGGMPDHIHILVDITPNYSLSDFVKTVKQESSYLIGNNENFPHWNGWQNGFAGFSYSANNIPIVEKYIINQKEHHKKVSFIDEYRDWLIEMGVSPDAPFFPK